MGQIILCQALFLPFRMLICQFSTVHVGADRVINKYNNNTRVKC